jgi:subtilisin family serine protease
MLQRSLCRVGLSLLLAALAASAGAQNVSGLRVMLHPYAAQPGQLPPAALATLTSLAGVPLALSGATRTGGLEFTFAEALSPSVAAAMVTRMRADRSVLWAEPISPVPASAAPSAPSPFEGQKLLVRVVGDATPDWNTVLPRWSDLAGMPLAVGGQIGNVWVLNLSGSVSEETLAAMAEELQQDSAVQYADPARRAFATLVPDDPLYSQQWALSDPVGGVNAPTAWDLDLGSADVTVAVVDTGITVHPDLAGRILPGYDFILNIPGASDPGDGTRDNQCGPGIPGEVSFFHGTFVTGLIAADTNNDLGIAGLDWNAKVLPVRALGPCGGTSDQILAAFDWAIGGTVPGAPLNPSPARVVNMSLAGFGACPQSLQDAINVAMAQGVVVVAAAGNASDNASNYWPANCSGVITVGASTRQGDITSYSNFGSVVSLSAPGGDGAMSDLILSTGNDGTGGPNNPDYEFAAGTSFAAPHVAGTASLMIARNANLTPGRIQDIISGATRLFAPGTSCGLSSQCGAGLLDSTLALQSTFPGSAVAPPGTVPVIEYYDASLDHYFITANPAEIAYLDIAAGSFDPRTGELFYAWTDPTLAPANAVPVCRFYAAGLINSYYYTADSGQCQYIIKNQASTWALEYKAAFYVQLPDATGACPANTLPVYKFFNNRADANQRHTIDLSVRRAMINRAWVPQGVGPNFVAWCTPI